MIHLIEKTIMGLTEVRRAGWLGLLTKDGLDGRNYSLQLTQLGPTGPGVKSRKVSATCSAMPCYSLRSSYKEELGKCSNTVKVS